MQSAADDMDNIQIIAISKEHYSQECERQAVQLNSVTVFMSYKRKRKQKIQLWKTEKLWKSIYVFFGLWLLDFVF